MDGANSLMDPFLNPIITLPAFWETITWSLTAKMIILFWALVGGNLLMKLNSANFAYFDSHIREINFFPRKYLSLVYYFFLQETVFKKNASFYS